MADAIAFVLSLDDKLSGPAKAAASSLGGLEKSLVSANASTGSFAEGLSALAGPAAAAASVLGAVGLAAGALVLAGAKLAIDASDFAGDTTAAYESMLGSAEAGSRAFEAIEAISKTVPQSAEHVHDTAAKLIASGVVEGQLAATVKSMADVESAFGKSGSAVAGKIQGIIEKAGAAGAFTVSAKSLAGTGVSIADLTGQLATQLGKSNAEIEKSLAAGKIKASDGIDAINAVIERKFGGLAAAQLTDLPNQIQKFHDDLRRMFQDVNAQPFLDALKQIGDLFDEDSATGRVMRAAVTSAFDAIFSAAAKALPYVKDGFRLAVIAALSAKLAFTPVARGLLQIATSAGLLKPGESSLKGMATAAKAIGFGLSVVASSFAGLALGIAVVAKVSSAISGLATKILMAGVTIVTAAFKVGSSIAKGVASGITSGISAVASAAKGLGGAALTALKGLLGIASPSRVFAQMGGYTAEGFSQGVEKGAPAAQRSVKALTAAPAQAGAARSGGGGGITVGGITVHIHGNADASKIRGAIVDAFEQLGTEMGVGPQPA